MKNNYFDKDYFDSYETQWVNGIDFDSEAARIYRILDSPKSLFDFGCGRGQFVNAFHKLCVNTRGCDISEVAIESSVAKKELTHVNPILPQVYGKPIDYEVAYFYGSLHYLPVMNIVSVMSKLAKHVKQIFIGDMPYSEMSKQHLGQFKEYADKSYPIYSVSYETFTMCMGNLGFFCEYVNWVEDIGTGKSVPQEILFIKK